MIRSFAEAGRNVLGTCFGASSIARVRRARPSRYDEAEFGFVPITLTDDGKRDPLLAELPETARLMPWHEDTSSCPLARLASSASRTRCGAR